MKARNQTDRLSPAQMMVVRRGLKAGLTKDQVATYANPAFSVAQMEQILMAYRDDRLKPSEIRVFADPLVSVEEMQRIRKIYRLSNEIEQDQAHLSKVIQDAERRTKIPSLGKPSGRHPIR